MQIFFEDNELERMASDYSRSVRKLGKRCADVFHLRIDGLRQADSLADMRTKPGRFHELMGDRKGQWACDLEHPYRLIFEPRERPIPRDSSGRTIWTAIRIVGIIEIVNYHSK